MSCLDYDHADRGTAAASLLTLAATEDISNRTAALLVDRLREGLAAPQIGHTSNYVRPLHLQPALPYIRLDEELLPQTERPERVTVSLPIWAGIPGDTQERVVAAVREVPAVRA